MEKSFRVAVVHATQLPIFQSDPLRKIVRKAGIDEHSPVNKNRGFQA
jgi:hypothetical protein